MATEQGARQQCALQGGFLANVTEENTVFLTQLSSNQTFVQNLSFSEQAFWINAWDGDDYGDIVILFFRGSIYSTANPNELHFAICETPTVPQQCNRVPPV